jgi:anti-sigma regulatory factor (Ser/Thr protein kinase)
MDNWDLLIDFVNESISLGISDNSRAYKLRLATEELISNIIRAADEAPRSDSKDVVLEISVCTYQEDDSSWFILKTKDNGRHFDPNFAARLPLDTEQPVSERPIGGLGLFLIQQSVDKVAYEWSADRNVYELWVSLHDSCLP